MATFNLQITEGTAVIDSIDGFDVQDCMDAAQAHALSINPAAPPLDWQFNGVGHVAIYTTFTYTFAVNADDAAVSVEGTSEGLGGV